MGALRGLPSGVDFVIAVFEHQVNKLLCVGDVVTADVGHVGLAPVCCALSKKGIR